MLGRMPWSSNGTFLVRAVAGDDEVLGVYKPVAGERPLWDFPPGLHRREVAAFELSEALGWALVPLTVIRADGPMGEGSVQELVDADLEQHYFTIMGSGSCTDELRRLCTFDLLANSADRKGGHCLLDGAGHVRAIDNGLTFHHEPKLRTVIWDFAGEEIPEDHLAAVDELVGSGLPDALAAHLDEHEQEATLRRARAVLTNRRFPVDRTGRGYPWPLV